MAHRLLLDNDLEFVSKTAIETLAATVTLCVHYAMLIYLSADIQGLLLFIFHRRGSLAAGPSGWPFRHGWLPARLRSLLATMLP